MADFTNYKVGLHNVGSYQVSGIPWITGSHNLGPGQEHRIEFPKVTKSVTVTHLITGAAPGSEAEPSLRAHFRTIIGNQNVSGGLHYVPFDSHQDAFTFNIKCKEIYISAPSTNAGVASYYVVAELTQINPGSMYELTGSGLTE